MKGIPSDSIFFSYLKGTVRVKGVKEMMMRKLHPPHSRRRSRAAASITRITTAETRALQAQRECEKAWWLAEVRERDRQLAALREERKMLLFVLRRERHQHSIERRSVAMEREWERVEWMRVMEDRETQVASTVLAMTVIKLTLMNQKEEQNQSASSAAQHTYMKALEIKGHTRGFTGQTEQRRQMWRPVGRSGHGGGQMYAHSMESTSTITQGMVTDMLKAHKQEALRLELLEKQRLRKTEAKATLIRTDDGSREARFWNLHGFHWFGISRKNNTSSN
ncbi:hypothetical protein ACEWY4_020103 [Coilia grayii]|uniref:Uncharacterized protein n=1 Tax=Coilia grayii TaxID=363190 RepID=A0ABD1JE00_9TELE